MSGLASADIVTYSTSGTFSCAAVANCTGGGTNSITISTGGNTLTLTYNGTSGLVNANPSSNAGLGTITASVTGTGGTVNTPGPLGFDLQISQSTPTSGTGDLLANLSGSVSINSSNGIITFLNSTNIGGVTWAAFPNQQLVIPPSTGAPGSGTTSLQGTASVPEPGSMVLLGTGLLSAGSLLRRKIRG